MNVLGGSFELHSEPGKRTAASLILPLVEVTGKSWPALSVSENGLPSVLRSQLRSIPYSHNDSQAPQNTARILLVDDQAMMRQGLRSVLDVHSDIQIVGEAGNGEEAVALVEILRPSLVVMDINMPKMNGIDATAKIKARHPTCMVIGLSVNADEHNREAMRQAGADLLLTKEVAVDELYQAIQNVLGQASEGNRVQ